jgi:hypothetical protein
MCYIGEEKSDHLLSYSNKTLNSITKFVEDDLTVSVRMLWYVAGVNGFRRFRR